MVRKSTVHILQRQLSVRSQGRVRSADIEVEKSLGISQCERASEQNSQDWCKQVTESILLHALVQ